MESDTKELLRIIGTIHEGCFRVLKDALGNTLPVAGNIGVFCQNDADYERFKEASKRLTYPSNNPAQKYFELSEPISFPEAAYTYLYIRKPAADSPEWGDVDFVLGQREYEKFKKRVIEGAIDGATVYERPGWDMVEIRSPRFRALAYVSTREMAEKVRVRF